VYPPERRPDPKATYDTLSGEKRSWKEMKTGASGTLRVLPLLPGGRCTYALVYVHAPARQKASLLLGCSERARVWVNGKLVHEVDRARPARPDEDHLEVSLEKGGNTVLVKFGSRPRWPGELSLRVLGDGLRTSLKPID